MRQTTKLSSLSRATIKSVTDTMTGEYSVSRQQWALLLAQDHSCVRAGNQLHSVAAKLSPPHFWFPNSGGHLQQIAQDFRDRKATVNVQVGDFICVIIFRAKA